LTVAPYHDNIGYIQLRNIILKILLYCGLTDEVPAQKIEPGNLVKITRASIGVPAGSYALVIKREFFKPDDWDDPNPTVLYTVRLINDPSLNIFRDVLGFAERRYHERDLEFVS